ncbi:MAG: ABC transporter substrate-binding protein [Actinomycetota bacterium]|nr:ABC transporter substrate-binding protein [Actinomycetota bacterium]
MSTSSRANNPTKRVGVRRALTTAAVAPLILLAACGGGGGNTLEGGSGKDSGGGEVVIAHQAYTEMEVMAEMYSALLEDAGFTPRLQAVDTRDLYVPPLSSGKVDVVPDYASSMTEFLNRDTNGAEAKPVASPDVEETIGQLDKLGTEYGVEPLEPAEAEDANAFAVTKEFSEENDLTTLSDLGDLGEPITLAAASDCPERPDCQVGLESTYGIEFSGFEPLGFGTVQTKDALQSGEVDLGQVGTSDGSLESLKLVVLEDDKDLQNAENLTPVVNSQFLEQNPDVADSLNKLSDVLTTEDLKSLNAQVDVKRELAEDVANQYLQDKGLLG